MLQNESNIYRIKIEKEESTGQGGIKTYDNDNKKQAVEGMSAWFNVEVALDRRPQLQSPGPSVRFHASNGVRSPVLVIGILGNPTSTDVRYVKKS